MMAWNGVEGIAAVTLVICWGMTLYVYLRLAKDGNRWGAEGLIKLVSVLARLGKPPGKDVEARRSAPLEDTLPGPP